MNTKLWSAFIIPMLLLSGCLDSSAESTPTVEPEIDTFDMIWGHQFNGSYPTSIANLTDFKLNETSNIKFNTWSRFHDPTDGERGYGNISIYGPDNYTWHWNTQESKRVVLEVDITQSGNYTLWIHTSGSNNDTENYPGDAMVVVTEVSTWN